MQTNVGVSLLAMRPDQTPQKYQAKKTPHLSMRGFFIQRLIRQPVAMLVAVTGTTA